MENSVGKFGGKFEPGEQGTDGLGLGSLVDGRHGTRVFGRGAASRESRKENICRRLVKVVAGQKVSRPEDPATRSTRRVFNRVIAVCLPSIYRYSSVIRGGTLACASACLPVTQLRARTAPLPNQRCG